MLRTISIMTGKGSTNHNERKFNAANTNPARTHLNVTYREEKIQDAYHKLFDEALEKYNAKQTRSDRIIKNYYEKIRTGKQEKPFYEIIVQIGNKDDMSAVSEHGELAKTILDEYFQSFEARNPNLYVFSAHLHMDEATPHLHIDFIPFTTGSNRGLETRVSMKLALKAQGFSGGSKSDTEWNQWVQNEKESLADLMAAHYITWDEKGTHKPHLSVEDYKLQERQKEIEAAESELDDARCRIAAAQKRIEAYDDCETELGQITEDLDEKPEYQLPEPQAMMSAKKYKATFVDPLIKTLKALIKKLVIRFFKQKSDYEYQLGRIKSLERENNRLRNKCDTTQTILDNIRPYAEEDKALRRFYGDMTITQMIEQKTRRNRNQSRGVRG